MANNDNRNNPNNGQAFWDFVQAFDPHQPRGPGGGVDHTQGFGSGFPLEGSWAPRGPWGGSLGRPVVGRPKLQPPAPRETCPASSRRWTWIWPGRASP
ncbi:hypothetical protein PG995_001254 [Apiospora arundinis]